MADYEANVRVSRKPCRSCGRQFVAESLVKHEPICIKQANKKRKVFDSTKQRSEGTEVSYRQMKQAQKKAVAPPKSHWRAQHADFINTIRAAKGVSRAMERGEPLPPPPPPSINPDYVQCPHCSRRFNEKAAQRHISFCKEQQKRLGSKPQPSAAAKAKMDARTSYQAPKPKGRTPPGGTSSPSGYASPGARGTPGAARGAAVGSRTSPNTGTGRTPGGVSGSGYRRQPAPGTRGRPSPSSNQYQASDYGDTPPGLERSGLGMSAGRALRTGRNSAVYNDARQGTKSAGMGMTKSKSSSSIRAGQVGTNSQTSFNTSSPSMPLGFTGGISRENESGYYSSSSENEVNNHFSSGKSSISRFCHECGTKYPVSTAKFCCECGVQRLVLT